MRNPQDESARPPVVRRDARVPISVGATCPASLSDEELMWAPFAITRPFSRMKCTTFAGSPGNFQRDVDKRPTLHNVLVSIELLADARRFLSERCASGIEPNGKRIKEHLGNSREDISLREAALKLEILTAEQFDLWVRPKDMTHPLERGL